MATKYRNPRVIVTFKPDEFDIVKRLAAVTDTTMSKAVHLQLEAVLPILAKVVESLEAARRTEGTARSKLVAQALKLHRQMDEVAAHALDQIDLFSSAAQGHAAASASERREPAERPQKGGGGESTSGEKASPVAPATAMSTDWEKLEANRERIENECYDDILAHETRRRVKPQEKRRRARKGK